MSRASGFGLEVSKGFVAKIILAAIGFLGSIVFARVLGPSEYGSFYVVLAVASVLDTPISGFGNACKKRISEHSTNSGEILVAGLAVAVIGSMITFAGIAAVGPYIDYFEIENGPLFIGVVFTGIVFFKLLQPMVAGIGLFGTAVMLDMVRSLITIPLQLLLVVIFGLGVGGMVYGLAIASLLTVPVMIFVLNIRPAIPTKETLESLWQYGKFSIPSNLVGTAYGRIDVLLLSAFLGSAAAGQYQVALQLVLPSILLSSVMGSGLFTEVSSQVSRNKNVNEQVTNNIAFASLFAIPIFFGAIAMPESIMVTVFGEQYRMAGSLLIGLGLFQIFRTQTAQVSSVLYGHDRPDTALWIMAFTLILNIILGIGLVSLIATLGVVIATVIAEGIKYLLLTYYARQHVRYNMLPDPLKCQFLAGGMMFVIIASLHQWVGISSWFDLLLFVGSGAIIYGTILVAISDVFMFTARHIFNDAKEQYL